MASVHLRSRLHRGGGTAPSDALPAAAVHPGLEPGSSAVRPQPLVSAIVPAFQAAESITAALESVLAQTYPNIEVVVVDDGSRDRTAERVAAMARNDARVRLVRQSNRGPAAARNTGIAAAHGEFIAPLDADDIWLPDKIAEQMALMLRMPDAGLVYSWSAYIDAEGAPTGEFVAEDFEGHVVPALVYGNFIGNGSAALIRRTCLNDVGTFDESPAIKGCEDLDLYLRIAARWRVCVVRWFQVGYRVGNAGLSTRTRQMLRAHRTVTRSARARHKDVPARVFRWGAARFHLYMAWQARDSAGTGATLRHAAAACARDPLHLVHPAIRWLLRSSLRRTVGPWLTPPGRWRRRAATLGSLAHPPAPPLSWEALDGRVRQRQRNTDLWSRIERRRSAWLRRLCLAAPPRRTPLGPSTELARNRAREAEV